MKNITFYPYLIGIWLSIVIVSIIVTVFNEMELGIALGLPLGISIGFLFTNQGLAKYLN